MSGLIKKHREYHKDGTLWARGYLKGSMMHGYWEWFRKNGTKMRSGNFKNGVRVGEWITYDAKGTCYKITSFDKQKTSFEMLSAPAQRALLNERIVKVSQLAKRTEKEILSLHGMGPASLPKLRILLKQEGLSFKK